jgi:hypothetical protein
MSVKKESKDDKLILTLDNGDKMLENKAEIKADILEPIDEKWNVEHK